MKQVESLIEFYLESLVANLKGRNSFYSLSSSSPQFDANVFEFSTVFSNAIILQNLMSSKLESNKITETLNIFLRKQKNNQLSFNYWSKKSPEYKKIPYPDDLDDTFCSLSALSMYDRYYLSGKDMRKITDLLVHQEAKLGGPYFTWIVGENDIEWKDIDLAVNSNIAYFLSLYDIDLPNITEFIEKAINSDKLQSKYYPLSTPIAYFISKWYQGSEKSSLILFLEKKYESVEATFLDKLLVSIALLNYNLKEHPYISNTLNQLSCEPLSAQMPYPFYRGVNPLNDGKKYYSGSQSLTTSFALEFLTLYQKLAGTNIEHKENNVNQLIHINEKIFKKVSKELITAKGEIKYEGLKRLKIMSKNPDMHLITAIPYITYKSIKTNKVIDERILEKLSTATLYGWLAYDIYDDFFDNQGKPAELSVANFSLRKLTEIFTSTFLPQKFHDFFHKIMNDVDNANAEECKGPQVNITNNMLSINAALVKKAKDLKSIYEKSIGHVLAVVAVYSLVDKLPNHKNTKKIINFFKHYLTARQIIDDMHDWEEDLRMGKLNSCTSRMIIHAFDNKQLELSVEELRLLFWEVTVAEMCEKVNNHIDLAHKYAGPFSKILDPLKQVITTTLREQENAFQFLSIKSPLQD